MNQAAFETYVETQLALLLNPGTVVILDNLSTHRSPRAAEALKEAKSWFLFLPPYSPDLNPIELAFSKLKAHLRRIGARTYNDLIAATGDVLRSLRSHRVLELLQDCRLCFRLHAKRFRQQIRIKRPWLWGPDRPAECRQGRGSGVSIPVVWSWATSRWLLVAGARSGLRSRMES